MRGSRAHVRTCVRSPSTTTSDESVRSTSRSRSRSSRSSRSSRAKRGGGGADRAGRTAAEQGNEQPQQRSADDARAAALGRASGRRGRAASPSFYRLRREKREGTVTSERGARRRRLRTTLWAETRFPPSSRHVGSDVAVRLLRPLTASPGNPWRPPNLHSRRVGARDALLVETPPARHQVLQVDVAHPAVVLLDDGGLFVRRGDDDHDVGRRCRRPTPRSRPGPRPCRRRPVPEANADPLCGTASRRRRRPLSEPHTASTPYSSRL